MRAGDVETNPQTLLFSATLPHWVHQTANKYLHKDRIHHDLVGTDKLKTSKTVQVLYYTIVAIHRLCIVGMKHTFYHAPSCSNTFSDLLIAWLCYGAIEVTIIIKLLLLSTC